ncbi:hypothetical protein GCM10009839_14210 [Catenulispora yoronensis]|uniref:Uncharacterized protein n=1 Tax=Catenulispora yoronensis TaxID=450799 RepID=A0ABP5F8N5_9ACTN
MGWDPALATYFCDVELPGGVLTPVAGGTRGEIGRADALAAVLSARGMRLPAVLVARLRLELLAVPGAEVPHLDWRSGEPTPIT